MKGVAFLLSFTCNKETQSHSQFLPLASLSPSLSSSLFFLLLPPHFTQNRTHAMAVLWNGHLVLGLVLGYCLVPSLGELERFVESPKGDGSLTFLVVGDWGRRGNYNQTEVAHQMGIIGEKLDIDFVVSTGDNFYEDGLTGVDDPAFQESFVNIYTHPGLQKQWYSVLGNHDYRGNVEAQLNPILRKMDSRWLCLRSFVVNAEIVELFFVDTTPFVDKYFTEGDVYDWSGVLPRKRYLSNLLKDVDLALKESRAKWKIVIGHHTIKSAGEHGNTAELVAQLLPIMQSYSVLD
ncbi:hypothetical protein BT93_L3404 [Corymbia citriodora subsp. variegata]|uniref:Calcineurin-like phosphoesterase domain-containing protein n=1 Tax=Corymbia citriodora subsp. variegata TaxID=360336 RepID=A0A8T0CLM0_CORYI|nr:hypothetical protein BT93_L3404 [Corymbia citriodora subsp. variegata]